MSDIPERLRSGSVNVERARMSGIAEHLAGWEHRTMAEAADEIERLRAALQTAMAGGNHLANVLIGRIGAGFADLYPPDTDHDEALRSLGASDTYEVWCCWRAIMNARTALRGQG